MYERGTSDLFSRVSVFIGPTLTTWLSRMMKINNKTLQFLPNLHITFPCILLAPQKAVFQSWNPIKIYIVKNNFKSIFGESNIKINLGQALAACFWMFTVIMNIMNVISIKILTWTRKKIKILMIQEFYQHFMEEKNLAKWLYFHLLNKTFKFHSFPASPCTYIVFWVDLWLFELEKVNHFSHYLNWTQIICKMPSSTELQLRLLWDSLLNSCELKCGFFLR